MMDVREKMVELLKTSACPSTFICDPTCKYYGFDDCFSERFADYLIDHGVTVQEWISVEDRLPEENHDGSVNAVLVTDGFVQHMAYFTRGEWRFAESGEIKEPMWYSVTHWMPLPQPPKVE